MIDFHSHILPGIDDGSKNTQMSLAMIEEEKKQGVHTIVATPHFYADEDSLWNLDLCILVDRTYYICKEI